MKIIRPGSPDANGEILAQASEASPYMLDLLRIYRCRVTFRDFDDTDTQEDLDIAAKFAGQGFPPTNGIIAGEIYIDLVRTWGGGTITAITMTLGQTTGANNFLTSTSLFTNQTTGFRQTPAATQFGMRLYSTTTAVGAFGLSMRIDTTGGNISTLTSGIVDIYVPFRLAPARRAA